MGEIDDYGLPILTSDENVEFVEIAVDESGMCKFKDEGHEFGV